MLWFIFIRWEYLNYIRLTLHKLNKDFINFKIICTDIHNNYFFITSKPKLFSPVSLFRSHKAKKNPKNPNVEKIHIPKE